MTFDKAIKSGKEHRVQYGTKGQPYCKAIDSSCRNHGSCPWCLDNRTKKEKNKNKLTKQEIKIFHNKI